MQSRIELREIKMDTVGIKVTSQNDLAQSIRSIREYIKVPINEIKECIRN